MHVVCAGPRILSTAAYFTPLFPASLSRHWTSSTYTSRTGPTMEHPRTHPPSLVGPFKLSVVVTHSHIILNGDVVEQSRSKEGKLQLEVSTSVLIGH